MLYDKYEERHCKERDSQNKVKRVKKTISSLNFTGFSMGNHKANTFKGCILCERRCLENRLNHEQQSSRRKNPQVFNFFHVTISLEQFFVL